MDTWPAPQRRPQGQPLPRQPSRRRRRRSFGPPGARPPLPWRPLAASAAAALAGGATVLAAAVALTPLHLPPLNRPTQVVDRDGRLLALVGAVDRQPVPLAAVPVTLRNALIATEDHTVWYNPGIDPVAIVRAAWVDLRAHAIVEGGSTLTQQLAKNLFLTQSRTFSRKFAELFWTLSLASHLSKRRILQLYLNTVYFGEGAYGVEAAARTYFGVPVSRLTLDQSALLAGLVDAPTAYDPYLHPQLALSRRNWVLYRMQAAGYLTPSQAARARRAPLHLAGRGGAPPPLDRTPYLTQFALAELAARAPQVAARLAQGGYVVHTTADLRLQYAARAAYDAHLPAPVYTTSQGVPEPEGALAALDPRTGGILALVGGRDFALTQFNRAVAAFRQPGSSFKAALYSALLLTGRYTPSSVVWDHPVRFAGAGGRPYVPTNASHRYLGPILMRRALAVSDNVAAVEWGSFLGLPQVLAQARRMGVDTPIAPNLTSILGSSPTTPLTMARMYASVANGGFRVNPYLVDRVVDPQGRVVYRALPSRQPAFDGRVAAILTDLLRTVVSPYGTAANLVGAVPPHAVGKTGTTNLRQDAWFVGFSPTVAAAVWVGDDQNRLIMPGEGSTVAGPIWADFMKRAYAARPWPAFSLPGGLVRRRICTIDGLLSNPTTPAEEDLYLAGTQPRRVSPIRYTGPPTLYVPNPGVWYWAYHPRVRRGLPLSGGPPLTAPKVWPPPPPGAS